jgi:hypothetical protein
MCVRVRLHVAARVGEAVGRRRWAAAVGTAQGRRAAALYAPRTLAAVQEPSSEWQE